MEQDQVMISAAVNKTEMRSDALHALQSAAVLQRARVGDLEAFETIFWLYHQRIYKFVYGMLGNPEDAEDVTQEVFLRLYRGLPALQVDKAFSAYLYRIAFNLCCSRLRHKKRLPGQSVNAPHHDEAAEELTESPDPSELPEEIIARRELQKCALQAVQTLSTRYRAVIVLRHFQDMPINDIARLLGVPSGTVKSRLSRGHKQLHHRLRDFWAEAPA